MQTSLFKKMLASDQVSHQVVKSSSLRQVMRAASRFNAAQPPEALISVFRHMNGADPKLVAKRLVADRMRLSNEVTWSHKIGTTERHWQSPLTHAFLMP